MSEYVELRAASAFSFLQAASLPEDMAQTAADIGLGCMAMADTDGVYGIPRFVKTCRTTGVRPLCGARITTDLNSLGLAGPARQASMLLLCRTTEGWQNLCELITTARAGREKDESVADAAMLERLSGGLVCIGGGMDGPVLQAATASGKKAGAAMASRLVGMFGKDNFFLDLQRHGDPAEERANRFLMGLSETLGTETVATNDVRYATADRSRILDVLLSIRNHTVLDETGRVLPKNHRRFIKRPDEMARLFGDMPGIVERTARLARSLTFDLRETGYRFPEYPVDPGETDMGRLTELVRQGVRRRYPIITPAVTCQIEHELKIIAKLNLAGYFLLVDDIVKFCNENGVLAQGRGSAANSAVCYSLGITAVDPISMGLLFERFLSEERGEWPDIDLDLPSGEDRESVIQHVYNKYGRQYVGMTAAVITFQGRNAVREAGQALGLDKDRIARLSRLIRHYDFNDDDDTFTVRLKEAGLDPSDTRVSHFIDMWHDIQHLPRHIGQHNGGLVISGTRLDRVVPIEPARMAGRTVIQWDKDDIADMQIIKVDLLGLGMLAAIKDTIELVERHEGVKVDLAHLPQNDRPLYDMLCRADTVGVFQIESRAQMATLPRMKPSCFYDLVVEVAIIRPGPIVGKMVHPFLERRAGRQKVTYAAPCLEPILKRTLGIPLFQEQLMRMAMVAAGFSGGEAEELRRAMGSRRSRLKMQRLVARLHEGMAANGIGQDARDQIVQSIVSFALYGFPESHAASFALIAYASAWLKMYHHAAFTTAILNRWPMGFYSPATLIQDAVRHGVTVLPVDVNRSDWVCTLEVDGSDVMTTNTANHQPVFPANCPPGKLAIRLGLKYIKGLSSASGAAIVAQRQLRGPYDGVISVGERAGIPRDELMLISEAGAMRSGAADDTRRNAMWQAMAFDADAKLLHGAGKTEGDYDCQDSDNFDDSEDLCQADISADQPGISTNRRKSPASDARLWQTTPFEDMRADFRTTGLTTGPHPVSFIRRQLDAKGVLRASDLASVPNGNRAAVAGVVIVRQRPPTAKGFYFATLEDETGHAAVTVRSDLFGPNRTLLSTNPFLLFEGVVQNRDGVVSILADRFFALPRLIETKGRNFH